MVGVEQRSREWIQRWTGEQLPYLIAEWEELPIVAAEIDAGSYEGALEYIEEWRLLESNRHDLEYFANIGMLTEQQQSQMAELRDLVTAHKPTLNRLLGL